MTVVLPPTVQARCLNCGATIAAVNLRTTLDGRYRAGTCRVCQEPGLFRVDPSRASEAPTGPAEDPPQPIEPVQMAEPEFPTHPDPNSRQMARGMVRSRRLARLRRRIVEDVARAPDSLGCSDWCHMSQEWGGHGPVSGALSRLWSTGLLNRGPRKRSHQGGQEWTYHLAPALADTWADIDWARPLDDIAEGLGIET